VEQVSANSIIGRTGLILCGDMILEIMDSNEVFFSGSSSNVMSNEAIYQRIADAMHLKLKLTREGAVVTSSTPSTSSVPMVPVSSGRRDQPIILISSDEDSDNSDEDEGDDSENVDNGKRSRVQILSPSRVLGRISRSVINVIDLVSSDDDDEVDDNHGLLPRGVQNEAQIQQHEQVPSEVQTPIEKRARTDEGTIFASSSSRKKNKISGVIIKTEFPPKAFGEADIEDEVVEVHDPNKQYSDQVFDSSNGPASKRAKGDVDSDEIEFVGGEAQSLSAMPHQREACFENKFVHASMINGLAGGEFQSKMNMKFCRNCYCYVCEVKASECLDWNRHCNASCKVSLWKDEKKELQKCILKLLTSENRMLFRDFMSRASRNKLDISRLPPSLRILQDLRRIYDYYSDSEDELQVFKNAITNISILSSREEKVQNLLMLAELVINRIVDMANDNDGYLDLSNSPKSLLGVLVAISFSSDLKHQHRAAIISDFQSAAKDFDGQDVCHSNAFCIIEALMKESEDTIPLLMVRFYGLFCIKTVCFSSC